MNIFLQWRSNLGQTDPSAENNYKSWIKAQNKASRCLKTLESKVTKSRGLKFNRERTYILSPVFIVVLAPKSIFLHSIWGLETKKKWCPRAWGSLLGGGDKKGRRGLPRQSRKREPKHLCAFSSWGIYQSQRATCGGQEAQELSREDPDRLSHT